MNKPDPDEIPAWDIALEGLIREESTRLGKPLSMEDLKHLAREYSIRFDDIMHTIVQLVKHERWKHEAHDAEGNSAEESQLKNLYVYNRVEESVAEKYSVTWEPLPIKSE